MDWESFWRLVGPVTGLGSLVIVIVRLFWDRSAQTTKTLREERDDFEKRWLREKKAREDCEAELERTQRRNQRLQDQLDQAGVRWPEWDRERERWEGRKDDD